MYISGSGNSRRPKSSSVRPFRIQCPAKVQHALFIKIEIIAYRRDRKLQITGTLELVKNLSIASNADNTTS